MEIFLKIKKVTYANDLKAGEAIVSGKWSNLSLINKPTRMSGFAVDKLSKIDNIFLSREYFRALVFRRVQISVWNF